MAKLPKATKWDLVRGTNLQSEDRFCLMTLFLFQGDGKAAFCKQSTLANEMGLTDRSVRRRLERLADKGVIDRTWGNRSGMPIRFYSINFEALKSVQRPAHTRTPASECEDYTRTAVSYCTTDTRTPASAPPGHQRPLHPDTSVLHEHPLNIHRTSNTSSDSKSDMSEWFQKFWNAFAHKVGRKKAEAAFKRAVKADAKARKVTPKEAAEHIIDIAASHATGFKADRTYQKHPTTWLNGEHWNDESVEVDSGDDWSTVQQIVRETYSPDVRNSSDVEAKLNAEQFAAAKSVGLHRIADANSFDKETPAAYRQARQAVSL